MCPRKKDLDHGKRAAAFVKELYNAQKLDLTVSQLGQLQFACHYHNTRTMLKISDVTIQTCLDSDRLDLWRIGIKPNPDYLYTEAAKKLAIDGFVAGSESFSR